MLLTTTGRTTGTAAATAAILREVRVRGSGVARSLRALRAVGRLRRIECLWVGIFVLSPLYAQFLSFQQEQTLISSFGNR